MQENWPKSNNSADKSCLRQKIGEAQNSGGKVINILYIIAESIKNKEIMIKRKGESETVSRKQNYKFSEILTFLIS